MPSFTHILEPIRINKLEVKNRIFRPGHGTYYGKGGVNDTLIAYHEARPRGVHGRAAMHLVPNQQAPRGKTIGLISRDPGPLDVASAP